MSIIPKVSAKFSQLISLEPGLRQNGRCEVGEVSINGCKGTDGHR